MTTDLEKINIYFSRKEVLLFNLIEILGESDDDKITIEKLEKITDRTNKQIAFKEFNSYTKDQALAELRDLSFKRVRFDSIEIGVSTEAAVMHIESIDCVGNADSFDKLTNLTYTQLNNVTLGSWFDMSYYRRNIKGSGSANIYNYINERITELKRAFLNRRYTDKPPIKPKKRGL